MTDPIQGSSARLDLIANLHPRANNGNCMECHHLWPCDTYRLATGVRNTIPDRAAPHGPPPVRHRNDPRNCAICGHAITAHTRTIGGTTQCHGPDLDGHGWQQCPCRVNPTAAQTHPRRTGRTAWQGQRETAVIYDEAFTFHDDRRINYAIQRATDELATRMVRGFNTGQPRGILNTSAPDTTSDHTPPLATGGTIRAADLNIPTHNEWRMTFDVGDRIRFDRITDT